MKYEQIVEVLNTRLAVAKEEGNPTEASFLYELLKMAEENSKKPKGCEKDVCAGVFGTVEKTSENN